LAEQRATRHEKKGLSADFADSADLQSGTVLMAMPCGMLRSGKRSLRLVAISAFSICEIGEIGG
jgi:hypothetical protein